MSSLDGERTWRDSINRLDDERRRKYFRLNVELPTTEPHLDDVTQMDGLRESVRLQPQRTKDVEDVLFALLATSFYFELDDLPVFRSGLYACKGSIRCRNRPAEILRVLGRTFAGQLETVISGESYGQLSVTDICACCHCFRKKISFPVLHLDEVINMGIKYRWDRERSISGFPHSIAWFCEQQDLRQSFGTADHDAAGRFPCAACSSASGNHVQLARKKSGRKHQPNDVLEGPRTKRNR